MVVSQDLGCLVSEAIANTIANAPGNTDSHTHSGSGFAQVAGSL
jgi:hypothetical protein